ncbi:single-pass membrane protein with aspartate-rich tail 1b [Electrophorus electricus]|uniref:Essential MCU regulator, mitochondrial n=1 Tax=Electrophorus electricus TaxID=8005 RepID=A0A4W4GRP6_ELEEL|nr:single-pass membrane protein with aspartate-rich tail 1b [Electrophorus electricus]
MANVPAGLLRTFLFGSGRVLTRNTRLNSGNAKGPILSRNVVTSTSGAILPKPDKAPFGLTRITVVVVPFLYMGMLLSKHFAAVLEENDIFVPDNDDDDD